MLKDIKLDEQLSLTRFVVLAIFKKLYFIKMSPILMVHYYFYIQGIKIYFEDVDFYAKMRRTMLIFGEKSAKNYSILRRFLAKIDHSTWPKSPKN